MWWQREFMDEKQGSKKLGPSKGIVVYFTAYIFYREEGPPASIGKQLLDTDNKINLFLQLPCFLSCHSSSLIPILIILLFMMLPP